MEEFFEQVKLAKQREGEDMNNLLEQLKQVRQAERDALTFISEMRRALEETIEYSQLKVAQSKLVEIQETLATIDGALRQEALDLYGLTGDKHPHEKVSIAISLEPIYQERDAIVWAINNALDMLKIDTKMFEKHAKAVLKTVPLPFVKVEEKPMVKIAREL